MSEYLKVRQQNLAERQKLLQQLNLFDAAEKFARSVQKISKPEKKEKPTSAPRPKYRKISDADGSSEETQPLRRSSRLLEKQQSSTCRATYVESDFCSSSPPGEGIYRQKLCNKSVVDKSANDVDSENNTETDSIADSIRSFYTDLHSDAVSQASFERWQDGADAVVEQVTRARFFGKFKVTKGRGSSMCFHPCSNTAAVVVGDKYGNVGVAIIPDSVVNIESCKSWQLALHDSPVTCVGVHEFQPKVLFSSSYDGLVRLDMEKCDFQDVITFVETDNFYRNFDFLSPDAILVCRREPPLLLIDCRENNNTNKLRINETRLRTVHVHPQRLEYFITASTTGSAKIWDIRNVKMCVKDLSETVSVQCAYFSPLSGSRILTLTSDDKLNLWTASGNEENFEFTKTSVHHDNRVGRWLTSFIPSFHPKCEQLVLCGSMKTNPRRVELFNANLRNIHLFCDPNLSTVCSLNRFHSQFNLMCGVNSSGYLHMWCSAV